MGETERAKGGIEKHILKDKKIKEREDLLLI